jgi:hypothetical protein
MSKRKEFFMVVMAYSGVRVSGDFERREDAEEYLLALAILRGESRKEYRIQSVWI